MILIDGKKISAELRQELKQEVAELKTKYNKVPGLTVILIGDMAPSQIYVRNKEKSANEVGLKSEVIRYPDTVEEKTILEKIEELNNDENISGILLYLVFNSATSCLSSSLSSAAIFFPSIKIINFLEYYWCNVEFHTHFDKPNQ